MRRFQWHFLRADGPGLTASYDFEERDVTVEQVFEFESRNKLEHATRISQTEALASREFRKNWRLMVPALVGPSFYAVLKRIESDYVMAVEDARRAEFEPIIKRMLDLVDRVREDQKEPEPQAEPKTTLKEELERTFDDYWKSMPAKSAAENHADKMVDKAIKQHLKSGVDPAVGEDWHNFARWPHAGKAPEPDVAPLVSDVERFTQEMLMKAAAKSLKVDTEPTTTPVWWQPHPDEKAWYDPTAVASVRIEKPPLCQHYTLSVTMVGGVEPDEFTFETLEACNWSISTLWGILGSMGG